MRHESDDAGRRSARSRDPRLRRFAPRVPGAIVAVVLAILAARLMDLGSHGVALVGAVAGGLPRLGLPQGVAWSEVPRVLGIAVSCAVLVLAQSAATSRSFALRHGRKVDLDQDLLGLSLANLGAGLSGTFVVNGSPTKTEVLDSQHGRSQVANLTMSAVVLLVLLVATGVLALMPEAALAAIVFLIGVGLIDVRGLRKLWRGGAASSSSPARRRPRWSPSGWSRGSCWPSCSPCWASPAAVPAEELRRGSVDEGGQPTYAWPRPASRAFRGPSSSGTTCDLLTPNAHRFRRRRRGHRPGGSSRCGCSSWMLVDRRRDYSASPRPRRLIDFVHAHGPTSASPVRPASTPRLVGT